jgi:RNase P protein component
LRETCRILLGECRGPWDIVLIARAEVLTISFAERVRVLSTLLREAGVLIEETAIA